MKILVCATEYPPKHSSGIGNVVYNISVRLEESGVDCYLCTPDGPDKIVGGGLIGRLGVIGLLDYWQKVDLYFGQKYDDFDALWYNNPLFLRGIEQEKVLITTHTTYQGALSIKTTPALYYEIAARAEKYCYGRVNKCASFVGVDPKVCKELENLGIDKWRIQYIQNGVDTKAYAPSSKKEESRLGLGFSSKDLIILSVGRLTAAKRPLELIRTFSIVAKGVPNAKLIMVGGGELTDEAKRLANALCPNNIQVLGYVPDNMILKLYPSADYFIIASKYEGQPLTLLEAMSSGLPCIVSEIPNLSMVAEAKCGLVTDFTEIHKAAAAILQYIQQDNSEHARNAREYVLENHDWSIIVQRYIEEFNRIARH